MKHNREQILAKGIELMRRCGYNATGIQDILKACEIPKGSFYNFFASKEAFTIEAVRVYSAEGRKALQGVAAKENLGAVDKIRAFFQRMKGFYVSRRYQCSCLMGNLALEAAPGNPQLAREIRKQMASWKAIMKEFVKQGQKCGEITPAFSAAEITDYLFDSYAGALVRMKYERRAEALDRFLEVNLALILQP